LPICIPLISFCCSVVLASTLSMNGESRYPFFVSNFSGIASSMSQFNLMLAFGLVYIAFIMFRYRPQISGLPNTFNMKGCCILSNAFLHLRRRSYDIFFFEMFI
jgi:Na+-translocating ferredoxin:NAD+ oxidoreductase RnfA subunit